MTLAQYIRQGTREIKSYSKRQDIIDKSQREALYEWALTPEVRPLMPDQHIKMKTPLAWMVRLPRKLMP